MDRLDTHNNFIKHRLYRQHVTPEEDAHFKDLDKIGRDLSKTILVDNSPYNFKLHPFNGLYIKTWKNDIFDQQLFGLAHLLLSLEEAGFEDIRTAVELIKNELDINEINSLENPYSELSVKKIQ